MSLQIDYFYYTSGFDNYSGYVGFGRFAFVSEFGWFAKQVKMLG